MPRVPLTPLAGLLGVVAASVRLLVGHWPVLLVIALLGEAGRGAALWAAVEISGVSSTLGVLVLALAPLCAVVALVLMLYSLRAALPGVRRADEVAQAADRSAPDPTLTSAQQRRSRLLRVLAGVLVPFLAVYASNGLLAADTASFRNAATYDEIFGSASVVLGVTQADAARTVLVTGWGSIVVVVLALLARQVLARSRAVRRVPLLAFAAAYLEVLWLATLARVFLGYQDEVRTWITERRAWVAAESYYRQGLELLGPVAAPVDAALTWLVGLVGSADALVVVPLAWLTVGAVVYGHSLTAPRPRPRRLPAPLARVTERVPAPVRRLGARPEVGSRFRTLWTGLRQLAAAGLGPMLVFALAFLVADRTELLLDQLWRVLVGPQDRLTATAIAPWNTVVSRTMGSVVLVCLVAAAVDRLLAATIGRPEQRPVSGSSGPGSPAPTTTAGPR